MIRDSVKQYTLHNKLLITTSLVFVFIFSVFAYIGYKNEIKLYKFVNNIHAVEINLFELTTFTKRMILNLDDDMWQRIAASKDKLRAHLLSLKTSNVKHEKELTLLESEIQNLFEVVDRLITIKQQKKQLIHLINKKVKDIDTLLQHSEIRIFEKLQNDEAIHLVFYKFDMLLSKLIRELGVYILTNDKDVLKDIHTLQTAVNEHKQKISMSMLTKDEKKLYVELIEHVSNKHNDIVQILEAHKEKVFLMKSMGILTDKIDVMIDENLDFMLKIEEQDMKETFALLLFLLSGLLGILFLYIIVTRNFFLKHRYLLDQGYRKVVDVIENVFNKYAIKSSYQGKNKNEFDFISHSLLDMGKELQQFQTNINLSENILSTFGELRFILNSDNTITYPSKNLHIVLGYAEDEALDYFILGGNLSFSTCKSLLKHHLIENIVWHFIDKNQQKHYVRLSAIYLNETSLYIIGDTRNIDIATEGKILDQKGIILIDAYGYVRDYNTSCKQWMEEHNLMKSKISIATLFQESQADIEFDIESVKALSDNKELLEVHFTKNNEIVYAYISVYTLFSDNGHEPAFVIMFYPLSNVMTNREKVPLLSKYDAVTNLWNRASFFDKLNSGISKAEQNNDSLELLVIDLVNFQDIIDYFEQGMGDRILIRMAKRIKNFFSETDIISKLSSEEFTVIRIGQSLKTTIHVDIEKLELMLNKKIVINTHIVYPKVTVGVSLYPYDGLSAKEILKVASTVQDTFKNLEA